MKNVNPLVRIFVADGNSGERDCRDVVEIQVDAFRICIKMSYLVGDEQCEDRTRHCDHDQPQTSAT